MHPGYHVCVHVEVQARVRDKPKYGHLYPKFKGNSEREHCGLVTTLDMYPASALFGQIWSSVAQFMCG